MDTGGSWPQPQLSQWTRGESRATTTPGTTLICGGYGVLCLQPQEGRSDFSKKCIAKDGTGYGKSKKKLNEGEKNM